MKKLIVILSAVVFAAACNNGTDNTANNNNSSTDTVKPAKLSHIRWILGAWQMNSSYGTTTEDWHEISATEWNGAGFFIDKQGDTLFSEGLRLIALNDTLWYLPTVPGQNDGKEVQFKEAKLSDTEVVFENPAHDFPQRIVYHKTSDTSILAYVEGKDNGKDRKEEFHFVKTKK